MTYSQNSEKKMHENIPNSVEIIDNHLDQFFDKDEDIVVFHEKESETIHRDVYFIKASDDLPYNVLLSCGMSALPMKVPENIDSSEFVEIMILLPKEWNLEYESFSDEKNYWPIRIMKEIMMSPHKNETWFGYGHTYGHEEGEEFASRDSLERRCQFAQISRSAVFGQTQLLTRCPQLFLHVDVTVREGLCWSHFSVLFGEVLNLF